MKPFFTDMVANDRLRERLAHEILSGSFSNVYILEGPLGSGKHMLAHRILAALSCERRDDPLAPLPCGTCPSCRKILSGNSPDLIVCNRGDKATFGVEAVRDLRRDVFIPPNDGEVKLYLIEEAQLLTPQAQNALLLTLENPPPYVLFLLLCESVAPLLETVRSRAPVFRTEPVEREALRAHLVSSLPAAKQLERESPDTLSEILSAAGGSIGRAIALLDPVQYKPILEARSAARELVRLAADSRVGSASALRAVLSMGQKRDRIILQCREILSCLRDLILTKQTDDPPLCFFPNREEAAALAYHFTTPKLLQLSDSIRAATDRLTANANVRLTLITLALDCGLIQL